MNELNPCGCKICNPRKTARYEDRKRLEWSMIDPLEKVQPLEPCEDWLVRYWDSLDKPHAASAKVARAALDALQRAGVRLRPEQAEKAMIRQNTMTQGDTQMCGWYVLFFMEEEIRRFRGEGAFATPPNWSESVSRAWKLKEKVSEPKTKVFY